MPIVSVMRAPRTRLGQNVLDNTQMGLVHGSHPPGYGGEAEDLHHPIVDRTPRRAF